MKYSIPYMGSKRAIAWKIVDKILQDNPNCKYFYDLFWGGWAISFETLQRQQIKKVFYNEKSKQIVELLKEILTNWVTEKFYKWIDRETFNKHKDDEDWFWWMIATCWSFGNNQKWYLFSKENEIKKKVWHEELISTTDYINAQIEDKKKIRVQYVRKQEKNGNKLQQLERLQQLEQLERLQQLQQLEWLERLKQLERLERLEQLEISNLSYEEVKIDTPIDNTVIYLDPPYENKAKYKESIDYQKLYEWINNSQYKIYLSSYEAPMEEVMSIEHRSVLSATNNSKKVLEKLFVNHK